MNGLKNTSEEYIGDNRMEEMIDLTKLNGLSVEMEFKERMAQLHNISADGIILNKRFNGEDGVTFLWASKELHERRKAERQRRLALEVV